MNPAKTFQPPEKAQASTASEADCGVNLPASLAKYDPDSRSWKTRQCLLVGGLDEFSEIWPRWGMMRNGVSYRLPTPSGLLELRAFITSASESGLSRQIGTAMASNKERSELFQRDVPALLEFVRKAPTPYGLSANQGQGDGEFGKAIRRLPTATATDGRKWNSKTEKQRREQGSSVRLCNHTDEAGATIGGQLNPQWVEWHMGWPIGFTGLEPLATAKFQAWRRSHGACLDQIPIDETQPNAV